MKKLILSCLILMCGVASAQTVSFSGSANGNKSPLYPTLSWSSAGATSCTASSSPVDANWNGTVALSGSKRVGPIYVSTSYVLTCYASTSNTVTMNWLAPYYNTDGTQITDLAGFRVYQVKSTGNVLLTTVEPLVTSAFISGLPAGTYTYYVTAYNAKGVESSPSVQGSKVIGSTSASKSLYVTVRK